jgi:hypothetical protein
MDRKLCALALLLVCGCERPDVPFVITAATYQSTMLPGETITVGVTLHNRSAQPEMIPGNQCGFHFKVVASDGSVVGPNPVFCTDELLPPITIAPGADATWTDSWSGGAVGSNPSNGVVLLAPATYTLVGEVGSEAFGATQHVSAPITILPATTTADGTWSGIVQGNGTFTFTLTHSAGQVSGTWTTSFPNASYDEQGTLKGSISGTQLSFAILGRSSGANCAGISTTLESQTLMDGIFFTSNCFDGFASAPFSATRH